MFLFRLLLWSVSGIVKLIVFVVFCIVAFIIGTGVYIAVDGLTDSKVDAPDAHTDAAMVMGTSVQPSGVPKNALKERLDRTVDLYKLGLFPMIIVSGAENPEDHETSGMTRYLVSRGVPAKCIVQDTGGFDTDASAKDIAQFCRYYRIHSLSIITHYYHITRVKMALSHYGVTEVRQYHAGELQFENYYPISREIVALYGYSIRYKLETWFTNTLKALPNELEELKKKFLNVPTR